MKYCKVCGNQLEDDAMFCGECGTQQVKKVTNGTVGTGKTAKENKSRSGGHLKGLIIVAVAAVLLICGIIAIIVFKSSTVTIDTVANVYITPEGFNGHGNVDVEIDKDAIEDLIRENDPDITEKAISNLKNSLKVEVSPKQDFSNGQEITLMFKYNKQIAKENKIKFSKEEWTHKFGENDFALVQEIDPFDEKYFTVEFSGVAPMVEMRMNASSVNGDIGTLSYESDYDYNKGYSVGDSIKVTCKTNEENLLNRGYTLSRKENTYTVSEADVDQYLNSLDQIEGDALTKMKKEAEDLINSRLVDYEGCVQTGDLTYEGSAFLLSKTIPAYGRTNVTYLVYSIDCTSMADPNSEDRLVRDTYFEPVKMYIPVEFWNVIQYKDGAVSFDGPNTYLKTSDIHYNNNWLVTGGLLGYTDSSDMFTEIIRQVTDSYNYTLDENLEKMF
ncbi:MAG: zinc-ribbon domain-containing protein [Lachnospiraceae bacterium]|nr:zinc-ribbon domain-containing protein [Lachnospiraceae bacterium]